MNEPTRAALCLAGWLLITTSGCASWPSNPLRPGAEGGASSFESSLSLARLSERHGEPATAAQLYEAILRENPQHQGAHHRLAVLSTKAQQLDKAEDHFQQALAGTPDSQLLSDRGYFLYVADQLDEAEAILRQALQLDPGNKAAHNNLGLVLGTQGRLDESLVEFRSVGDEASARANLAYVHALNGAFDQAEAEYHRALELNSQLKPAVEALLALHARRDPSVAAALANPPIAPAGATRFTANNQLEGQPVANLPADTPSTNPTASHSDRFPQVATVSFEAQERGHQSVSRAVEATRPLMNSPSTANAVWNVGGASREPSANRQATTHTAPSSMPVQSSRVQSSTVQPWQSPTWQ